MLFWIIVFLVFIFAIGLLVYMYKEAFRDQVVYNRFLFDDFPESFGKIDIFFISDIHRRIVADSIINEVKGKADLVIVGGDLLEKGVSLEQVKNNILKLKEVGPVYFVWGNNDYEVDYHLLDATLLELGVKILDNTAVSFESHEGEQFIMLGVDDMSMERDRLDLALHDVGQDGFKILISHNPKITDQIEPGHEIRLVLSGHTHGGQIHLVGYSPFQKGGMKKLKQTTLFVSNGYGTTAVPLRLGAKAQTHLITLTKK